MKKYIVNNEILNIADINNLSQNIFFRKVTPKFFSHDEDEYHIESKIEVILNYIDENNHSIEKTIGFHKEHQIEYIGQEVEVEIEEFIELLIETEEFSQAKSEALEFVKVLKEDFNF